MSPVLAKYQNGNCFVELFGDGTTTRSWEGDSAPKFPCSMDLKITDFCDAGCQFCHEQSTRMGVHAKVDDIFRIVDGLPAGVELAIGGGNPLAHPSLRVILEEMRYRGLVPNVTINALHLGRFAKEVKGLRKDGLLFGLGVSFAKGLEDAIESISDSNTVVHLIAGIHSPWDALRMARKRPVKILVLGYKKFGFGSNFYSDAVDRSLGAWRYWIGSVMGHPNALTSFDNLALEQLRIKSIIPSPVWDENYMGDDGTFTMYVDAVRMEFAPTSTSRRTPCRNLGIAEMFAEIKGSR